MPSAFERDIFLFFTFTKEIHAPPLHPPPTAIQRRELGHKFKRKLQSDFRKRPSHTAGEETYVEVRRPSNHAEEDPTLLSVHD